MNVTTKRHAKILIQKMIKKDMEAWPPECFGWLYQAQRPLKDDDSIADEPNKCSVQHTQTL